MIFSDMPAALARSARRTTAFAVTLAGVAVLALSSGAAADPAYGTYKTIPDDNGNFGHIQVGPCGARICGTLVKSFGPDGAEIASDNLGRNIIWDMQADGAGAYSGGQIWDPSRDKTYKSKMKLNGRNLSVSGCILMVCRDGGTWTRVN